MRQLAPDVHLLRGFPPNAINVYLVGDVLIDAATRQGEKRILRQIAGHAVTAHALTHAHPDHQGASHAICERLEIPLWCGVGDVPAMETPGAITNSQAPGWLNRLQDALLDRTAAPGRPRAEGGRRGRRASRCWRPRALARPRRLLARVRSRADPRRRAEQHERQDRRPRLHEPPRIFTPDPARNRQSIRRLAALRPSLVCFGHGAPLRDGQALARFRVAIAGVSDSVFVPSEDGRFEPTEHARGPWDPRALHGGAPGRADRGRLRADRSRLGAADRAAGIRIPEAGPVRSTRALHEDRPQRTARAGPGRGGEVGRRDDLQGQRAARQGSSRRAPGALWAV